MDMNKCEVNEQPVLAGRVKKLTKLFEDSSSCHHVSAPHGTTGSSSVNDAKFDPNVRHKNKIPFRKRTLKGSKNPVHISRKRSNFKKKWRSDLDICYRRSSPSSSSSSTAVGALTASQMFSMSKSYTQNDRISSDWPPRNLNDGQLNEMLQAILSSNENRTIFNSKNVLSLKKSGTDRLRCNGLKPVPPIKPTRLRNLNSSNNLPKCEQNVYHQSTLAPTPLSSISPEIPQLDCLSIAQNATIVHENEYTIDPQDACTVQDSNLSTPISTITELGTEQNTLADELEEACKLFTDKCSLSESWHPGLTIESRPKIKPPPPPMKKSRRSTVDFSVAAIETAVEAAQITSESSRTSSTRIEKNMNDDKMFVDKPCRFERQFFSEEFIPSAPSIPPPPPPTTAHYDDDCNNDEMYEEITQSDYPENFNDNEAEKGMKYSDKMLKIEQKNIEVINGASKKNGRHQRYMKKEQSATLMRSERKKRSNLVRPKSVLEFDRLLRIKSDIQLNITKKVGQIKLRVGTATHRERSRKDVSSKLHITDDKGNASNAVDEDIYDKYEFDDDDEVLAKIKFPLDEQYIYGDDWSSDDDFETKSAKIAQIGGHSSDDEVRMRSASTCPSDSMLSEIVRELKLKYNSGNLPDMVFESKRKSMSVDDLSKYDDQSFLEQPSTSGTVQVNVTEHDQYNCTYGRIKSVELLPTIEGYETVEKSHLSSEAIDHQSSSPSDYTLKEIDRSIYTPRIIPDPQPLYQIYMMEEQTRCLDQAGGVTGVVRSSIELETNDIDMNDKKIRRKSSTTSTDSGRGADSSTTASRLTSNTSMRRERLVAGSHFGSQRSLWCELPEVISSGLLEHLNEETKKLQEAFFEVITSEASYLRSLNILITHFMAAPELLGAKGPASVITNEQRKHLFSNIFAVRDCSERLLSDLESRLQINLVLNDVCDILCEHFENNFDPYVKYCSNQVYQDRTLKKLKCENSTFLSCIQRLECDRQCQGLDMRSFLMLPMQRITRYPLLTIAILERTQINSVQNQNAQAALHLANNIVVSCNEGARRMDRTELLLDIERHLIYKSSDLRRIPLVISGRYLVKRGLLMCLNERLSKRILLSRQQFNHIYIFLFSDLILLTKKKDDGTYVCKDYAARRFVDIEPVEIGDQRLLQSRASRIPLKNPHLFICTLMHNARGRQVELLLNADSETDRERWISALQPPACSNPEEKIYADWDCPQAITVYTYSATQEDELQLEKGDLVNILRKIPDGWFYGERVRDGCGGWFPASYVQQLLNDHVRAKNYRERLRMIQAAASFQYRQQKLKSIDENVRTSSPYLIGKLRKFSSAKSTIQ